jgi:hypothetical protein
MRMFVTRGYNVLPEMAPSSPPNRYFFDMANVGCENTPLKFWGSGSGQVALFPDNASQAPPT